MILSDRSLRTKLGELEIQTQNPNFAFDEAAQVKQCSIDLRLCEMAWEPKRFRRVDLSDAAPRGRDNPDLFKKIRLSHSEGQVLRPGQFLLCRTYEQFRIPDDLFGMLRGRSSFGRLGLGVVGPSSTINPGWRGHMPLMLVNHSPFRIVLFPYISVVQLVLAQLDGKPVSLYGSEDTDSKYQDDDGGPSRYWLDTSVSDLKSKLAAQSASKAINRNLLDFISQLDNRTENRFRKFAAKYGTVSDPGHMISEFIASERRRPAITWVIGLIPGLALTVLVRLVFNPQPLEGDNLLAMAVALGVVLAGIFAMVFRHWSSSMTISELKDLARKAELL